VHAPQKRALQWSSLRRRCGTRPSSSVCTDCSPGAGASEKAKARSPRTNWTELEFDVLKLFRTANSSSAQFSSARATCDRSFTQPLNDSQSAVNPPIATVHQQHLYRKRMTHTSVSGMHVCKYFTAYSITTRGISGFCVGQKWTMCKSQMASNFSILSLTLLVTHINSGRGLMRDPSPNRLLPGLEPLLSVIVKIHMNDGFQP